MEEGPRRQPAWVRRSLQAMAVLAGVILALAGDAAREYRGDRADERAYRVRLEADFEENRARLDDVLAFHESAGLGLRRLLSVIDSGGTATISTDSINALLLSSMYSLPSFRPVLATLDDILQSGRLNLIMDDSLRSGLVRFQRSLTSYSLAEEYAEDYWRRELVVLFMDDVPVRDLFGETLGRSAFPANYRTAIRSRRFESKVVNRVLLGDDIMGHGENLRAITHQILRRLDELKPD